MLFFKFHQNRTINEEFDFWGLNPPSPSPPPRGEQGDRTSKIFF